MVMASFKSSIDPGSFWFNFLSLRNSWENDIPLDTFIFHCKPCNEKVIMNPNGVIFLDDSLEEPISDFMTCLQTFHIEEHITCSDTCAGDQIELSEEFGPPVNVVVLLPPTENRFLTSFTMENYEYEPQITVQSKEDNNKSILVLYKLKSSTDYLYSDFINDNFYENINVNTDAEPTGSFGVEDIMIDEEAVSEFRHLVPRLSGGGRKLDQHYNYFCSWCPKDDLQHAQKGKFVEIKNFRDHFRRVHSDVPYEEFLRKVPKRDPKWCCPNCRRFMSISNSHRHKLICKSDEYEDSDDNDNDQEERHEGHSEEEFQEGDNTGSSTSKGTENNSKKQGMSSSSSDTESEIPSKNNSELESEEETKSSSERQREADQKQVSQDVSLEDIMETDGQESNVYEFQSSDETADEISKYMSKKKVSVKDKKVGQSSSSQVAVLDPTSQRLKSGKIKKIFRKTSEGKYRIVEVSNNNTIQPTTEKVEFSIRDEFNVTSETDTDSEQSEVESSDISPQPKWWMNHATEYLNKGYHGMDIFLKDDTEEFVSRVITNWKIHQAEKIILDKKMEEIENSDLSLNQFSILKDEPILEEYSKFVQSNSTKDVLNLFAADYDENSVQRGAKSSTAKAYEKRIVELFTFLAKKYDKFHLDWFTDYSGKIEKVTSKGEKTFDLFVLTKEDLLSFVAQYKYGINPAANVNLRIFAVKRFLEFLVQNYKDNEDQFPGSLLEKSSLVECLSKKLADLNKGICPDGTIKKISIASNKNHKQTLIEQMKKCPEKSLKKIMDGVASYMQSDEYSNMKTMLFEYACKRTKIPSRKEYMTLTQWLLEMLICLGGNRPCALLGITVGITYSD